MPFQVVETQRLYQQVAEQVSRLIETGELARGERLPAERDLAAKLGVSRPTVREAMIALEIAGLVEVRTGAGIYVRDSVAAAGGLVYSVPDAGVGPLELIEARRVIECEVAARAAAAIDDAQLRAITETLTMMAEADGTKAHREADRLFHRRIAEATNNAVLIKVVDRLWTDMFSPIFERLGAFTGLMPDSVNWTLADHREICAALEAHDPDRARSAMDLHLNHVEAILLKDAGSDGASAGANDGAADADA